MRIVLQRVSRAAVRVDGLVHARIGRGLLALVAVEKSDSEITARVAARRVARLRIFEDSAGKMNLDATQVGAAILVVSQFTLAADLQRGRRPSFGPAAPPEIARTLVEEFASALRAENLSVETGVFGAHMEVELVNDGPVTFVLAFGDEADASW